MNKTLIDGDKRKYNGKGNTHPRGEYRVMTVNITEYDLNRLDEIVRRGVIFSRTEAFRQGLSDYLDRKYNVLQIQDTVPRIKEMSV